MEGMHHKCGALAVFVLGLIVSLSLGAAPALAADGCDCHTADPPTATAAHTPYVASISDCTDCHAEWTVPHPAAYGQYHRVSFDPSGPELWGYVWYLRVFPGGWMPPSHGAEPPNGIAPQADVDVYLQQQPWGQTAWTDLGQAVTDSAGRYTFTLASEPPRFTVFRAIAAGHLGALPYETTGVLLPTVATSKMAPQLTLKYRGLHKRTLKLGRRVRATVTVAPADIGVKLKLRFQKRVRSEWRNVRQSGALVVQLPSTSGTVSLRFRPHSRGWYRAVSDTRGEYDLWHFGFVNGKAFRVR